MESDRVILFSVGCLKIWNSSGEEKMDAAAFQSHSVLGFSMGYSFSRQCYLGNSCISMREVAVQPSPYALQKAVSPLNNSSIRSGGDKGGQTSRRKEGKRSKSFNGKQSKSPDQEEIISLIKRIRVSISKGYSENTGKLSSNAEKDKPSTETSPDILREPKKQVKVTAGNISNRAKEMHLSKRIALSRTEQGAQKQPHVSSMKLTRQLSNFVKKSPIPFLSPPRGNVIVLTSDASPATEVDTKAQSERLEELRLAELKELAKSRGVRGYSKLKKDELIKILGS